MSLSPKRGAEATGVHLDGYSGTAVHDGRKSHWKFDCKHAVCNARILRELKFLAEARKRFGAAMFIGQLRVLHRAAKEAQRQGKSAVDDFQGVKKRFQDLVDAALLLHPPPKKIPGKRGRPKKSKERNLLERRNEHWDEALAFARDFSFPFDNNQAERDVRPFKVAQKIAGGWRTESGAKRQWSLRSFFSNCQKPGLNLLQAAINAFNRLLPRLPTGHVTT